MKTVYTPAYSYVKIVVLSTGFKEDSQYEKQKFLDIIAAFTDRNCSGRLYGQYGRGSARAFSGRV